MKILFNPKIGKPIGRGYNDFVAEGVLIDPHLPGELKQYSEPIAQILLETFEFLTEVTPSEAQKILEKPKEGKFKCEYCDYSTDMKIALTGHLRSHKKEIQAKNEPLIDPSLVPVAKGEKIVSPMPTSEANFTSALEKDIPNGPDKDGVPFYGEGLTEERGSMEATKPFGEGHFGGQPLTDK